MSGLGRLEELLAERATQGLGDDPATELEALLAARPDADPDEFDRAAAALNIALLPVEERMPDRLRTAILERARVEVGRPTVESSLAPVVDFASARTRPAPSPIERRTSWTPWLAAAAALLLAVVGWWPRLEVGPIEPPGPVATVEPRIEEVAAAEDAIRWPWSGTEDPAVAEAGGEVVWSASAQRGFMRIRGLEANEPTERQYQLWIFDRAQDERYPVDGGVFDVPAGGGEVVIPINAKIAVDEPYLFAVTVEKPGGVVVSSRERIVLLAQV